MDSPSVYIETSIVSYLAARPSRDPVTLRNQQLTHEWWTQRHRYALWTSEYVLEEAAAGDVTVARRRLALLATIPLLAGDVLVDDVAGALRKEVPLPSQAHMDAFHISIATIHRLPFLLTWDTRHIANPRLRLRIDRTCMARGYRAPRMCTPLELIGK